MRDVLKEIATEGRNASHRKKGEDREETLTDVSKVVVRWGDAYYS